MRGLSTNERPSSVRLLSPAAAKKRSELVLPVPYRLELVVGLEEPNPKLQSVIQALLI